MLLIKRIVKSKKGGIPTIITIVATTIVAMGLFSYTIINQSTQVKEAGDRALFEQNKINMMLENPDVVTGKTVKGYIEKLGDGNCILNDSTGDVMHADEIIETALFEMSQTYDESGQLISATFIRVDLGS